MKKFLALALAMIMVIGCLAGCGGSSEPAGGDAAAKDVLTVAHVTDCGDMNPHGLTSMDNWKIKAQCYETLFTIDFDTNNLVPVLATDYEWIDNQTLKLKLREGVQFHNGYGEMTAEDVLFSLNEVYNSAANYPIAQLDMDACEVVDDYTIILRTVEPYAPLLNNLSNCACGIFSKAGFEADGGKFTQDIGTGPFYFEEWLEGESVTQARFDEYWDGPAKLSKIIWKVIDSGTSRAMELQTGGCDLAVDVSLLDREKLESEGFDFEYFWTNDLNTLVFNCELPMFKENTTLRRALAYAVDTEKFATTGKHDPDCATTLNLDYHHPYAFADVDAVKAAGGEIIEFNLDKAKELFTEAGYFDPSSDIYNYTFKLEISPGTSWEGWCQAYKSDLASIGVNLDIVSYDWATYVNDIKVSRDFELCAWGTAPVTGDWEYFALHYYGGSSASINIPQSKNAEFDAIVDAYRKTTDPEEQKKLAQEGLLLLYHEYYQVPLYETVETYARASNLKGFNEGQFQSPLLKTCYFE